MKKCIFCINYDTKSSKCKPFVKLELTLLTNKFKGL